MMAALSFSQESPWRAACHIGLFLSLLRFVLALPCLALFSLGTFFLLLLWLRRLPPPANCVAFFHPQCDAGAGGERVLWSLVAHELRKCTQGHQNAETRNAAEARVRPPGDGRGRTGEAGQDNPVAEGRREDEQAFPVCGDAGSCPTRRFVAVYVRHDSPWLESLEPVDLPDVRLGFQFSGRSVSSWLLSVESALLHFLSVLLSLILGTRFHRPRVGYAVTAGSRPAQDLFASFSVDLDPLLSPEDQQPKPPRKWTARPATVETKAERSKSPSLACHTETRGGLPSSSLSLEASEGKANVSSLDCALPSPLVLVPVRSSTWLLPCCYPFCSLLCQGIAGGLAAIEVLLLGVAPSLFIDTVGFPAVSFVIAVLQRWQRFSLNWRSAGDSQDTVQRGSSATSRVCGAAEMKGSDAAVDCRAPRFTRLRVYIHYPFVRACLLEAAERNYAVTRKAWGRTEAPAATASSEGGKETDLLAERQTQDERETHKPVPRAPRLLLFLGRGTAFLRLAYYRFVTSAYVWCLRFAFNGNQLSRKASVKDAKGAGSVERERGGAGVTRDREADELASFSCCNSSWTRREIQKLVDPGRWRSSGDDERGTCCRRGDPESSEECFQVPVAFPPCQPQRNMEKKASMSLSKTPLSRRPPRIMSIAQFRPEKRHTFQVRIFKEMCRAYGHLLPGQTHLVVAGMVKNKLDANIVQEVCSLAYQRRASQQSPGERGLGSVPAGKASSSLEAITGAASVAGLLPAHNEDGWRALPSTNETAREVGSQDSAAAREALEPRDLGQEEASLWWRQTASRGGAILISSRGFRWVASAAAAGAVIESHLADVALRRRDNTQVDSGELRKQEVDFWGEHVFLLVNAEFAILDQMAETAKVGLHTMAEEHFGIAVVQLLCAGCCVVAHNSGGPRDDILVAKRGEKSEESANVESSQVDAPHALALTCRGEYGFLCSDETEFAATIAAVLSETTDSCRHFLPDSRNAAGTPMPLSADAVAESLRDRSSRPLSRDLWSAEMATRALESAHTRFLDDEDFGFLAASVLHLQ
ncbi:putative glycosyltransferase [Toxoplasma gondii FOU]|uniref:Putative glycosyltransferase n=1 Tax=Toxoplasma gondii FOU TaxID=943167 RepID=A0A086LBF9_TOXGO|nr:putative glycosyltransferase [Toxoplasma gondii FOU]